MPAQPPSRTREGEGLSASGASHASLDRGDIVNALGHLRRCLEREDGLSPLTDVQNRLVMRQLAERGLWAHPRAPRERQRRDLVDVLSSLTHLGRDQVDRLLEESLEVLQDGNQEDHTT